jgi:ribonucleoside-diphosphate reductase alpha chain
MRLERLFTKKSVAPEDQITWKQVQVAGLAYPIEVPEFWSETAAEIAGTRYLRLKQGETSVRQLFRRVVDTLAASAESQGYLDAQSAQVLADEILYILLNQLASFNSPVYFNAGIFAKYGYAGVGENYGWDFSTKAVQAIHSAYIRPQVSACFIQGLEDDLLSIFNLLRSEAKLFKYGSGTGTNFSKLRPKGAPLEGGGESTGVLSFLEIFDKSAQAIKSGGTNRRAAKMVILDADHPQILDFVHWKRDEERKARVLLAGGYSGGMDGEAYRTVSGQNSNNSVRVNDAFMVAAQKPGTPEAQLFREMAKSAWECADPGIQFHDTIQRWHICPEDGPIRASNPCSEFMFLDDTACNLASINLVRFLENGVFNWEKYAHVVRLMLFAQEIFVDYAAYPTACIALNSHRHRPLGLGYSNLGGLFMHLGIPYDSELARQWTIRVTGAMHALALQTSLEMAKAWGPFDAWKANSSAATAVLHAHNQAWLSLRPDDMQWVDEIFQDVCDMSQKVGLRNAQVTLIAPTGTIGLLMDCETLGIEPDFALVKRKTLSGGGELRLVNRAVPAALHRLGYSQEQVSAIVQHIDKTGWIRGAPDLREEHLRVFDCAMAPSADAERRVSTGGHLRIMAAAQPFLSGAISKTVNLPVGTTVENIEDLLIQAWKAGLKSVAIYRDQSKVLQPLCTEC